MLSALISFFGGSVFRMVWGEVSAWLTAKQQHAQDIESMKLKDMLDAAAHVRSLEAMKAQAELGVKTIEAQSTADAFTQAVKDVGKSTGIVFIDIWNGSVRPALATAALIVICAEVIRNGWVLNDWDRELVGAILGVYVADRALVNRGK
jgi:hypothetical protein